MDWLVRIIFDFIHIIGIFLFCESFFSFSRRDVPQEKLKILTLTVISSIIIQLTPVTTFTMLVYVVSVFLMLAIYYEEPIKKLFPTGVFVMFLTSMLNMMSLTLVSSLTNTEDYTKNP